MSSPFNGRRIETPGTDSEGAELLEDLGTGERYLRRLVGDEVRSMSTPGLTVDYEWESN